MAVHKLQQFLERNEVQYVSITHSAAYTAQEIAASSLVSGKEIAKTVIVKAGDKLIMTVLPASYMIDFRRLQEAFDVEKVELADEKEFMSKFPGCEIGAMPPFGNLFGMDVYVATRLTNNRKITFNAGTQSELISLAYKDFERLVSPEVLSFCYAPANIAA